MGEVGADIQSNPRYDPFVREVADLDLHPHPLSDPKLAEHEETAIGRATVKHGG
jgi:hypothetical protein